MLVLVQWSDHGIFQLRNIESSCDKLEVAWKDFEERKRKLREAGRGDMSARGSLKAAK